MSFFGEDVTYSGYIGLLERKKELTELSVKNPVFLTKYAMKIIAKHLDNLKVLR